MGNKYENKQEPVTQVAQPVAQQSQVMQSGMQATPTAAPVQAQPKIPIAGTKDKTGKKIHKTFGEYKKCIVHLTAAAPKNSMAFASVNNYTVEITPEQEVELPIGIINFLKNSTLSEGYFDKNAVSDNGNRGAHLTREVKRFIVEIL